MFIQGYGDKTMGLWGTVLSLIGTLAGAYASNKLAQKQMQSSPEYKKAMENANLAIDDQNKSIARQQELAGQYTGNAGYENSLAQAGKGAGLLANQAVGAATSGARASGLSKAQAAQMGLQSANQMYANAFQNQQANAMGMGQNALSAQQGITSAKQGVTSAQQGMAGLEQSETQNRYNRGADTFERGTNAAANAIGTLGKAFA